MKALVTNKDGVDLLVQLQEVLGERSSRAVPVKEEEEGEGPGGQGEEEERILGEFSSETVEIIEELEGVVADVQGEYWYLCLVMKRV